MVPFPYGYLGQGPVTEIGVGGGLTGHKQSPKAQKGKRRVLGLGLWEQAQTLLCFSRRPVPLAGRGPKPERAKGTRQDGSKLQDGVSTCPPQAGPLPSTTPARESLPAPGRRH